MRHTHGAHTGAGRVYTPNHDREARGREDRRTGGGHGEGRGHGAGSGSGSHVVGVGCSNLEERAGEGGTRGAFLGLCRALCGAVRVREG